MDIKELVHDYIENKSLEDKYKKIASSANNKIKEYFSDNDLDAYEADNGTVKMTERKSESFDEDKLIAFLKQSGHSDIVKTVETVDYDALESAIYHEDISKDEVKKMDDFKTVKITKVLNIKK